MSIPTVLERIATALETIAAALTGETPAATPVPRARRPFPDTEFEWDTTEPAPAVAPLPEPAPPVERCGFLIEQFVHPLDRKTPVYQVSKQGVTKVLDPGEAEELAAMDDAQFAAVMGGRLAEVLSQRVLSGRPGVPDAVVLPPEDDDELVDADTGRRGE